MINNTADDGGAIVISDNLTNISHSRFTNNSARKKREAIILEGAIYSKIILLLLYAIALSYTTLRRTEEKFLLH